jgi:hypothetical protein
MQCTANWATIENFSAVVAGMNGGKDAKVNGRLPGFAAYVERNGEIIRPAAGVACELCGEHADRYGRCGCDF